MRGKMEQITDYQSHEYNGVSRHEGGNGFGTEVGEYLGKYLSGNIKRRRPKEYPAGGHNMEREQNMKKMADNTRAIVFHHREYTPINFMDNQQNAMPSSPYHKKPRSSMPKSTQHHSYEQIEIGTDFASTIPAQRYIEIVSQPTRQRDMPATPELGNRTRLIGRIEIDFKTIPHKQGYADSHIGITRKITVYLQGIAIDTHKILESGIEHGIVKNAVYEIDTNVVGDNYLFNQPAHDEKKDLRPTA